MSNLEALHVRAKALNLHGLLAHWGEAAAAGWLATLIDWEEQERTRRSLERRLRAAHIGRFKPLCDFDWTWPKRCDRSAFEALMALDFLKDATNAILVGPNGVGKSTLARNIAHQALIHGHTVLFTSAGQLLGELAALDSDSALRRRLRHYAGPRLLVIDEVGYLSYSNRHADLLFELVSRRYEHNSTLVTTNRPFAEWREVFPNAACVVSLVDRLVHNAEVLAIEGESYRLKEAQERAEQRARHDTEGGPGEQAERQSVKGAFREKPRFDRHGVPRFAVACKMNTDLRWFALAGGSDDPRGSAGATPWRQGRPRVVGWWVGRRAGRDDLAGPWGRWP